LTIIHKLITMFFESEIICYDDPINFYLYLKTDQFFLNQDDEENFEAFYCDSKRFFMDYDDCTMNLVYLRRKLHHDNSVLCFYCVNNEVHRYCQFVTKHIQFTNFSVKLEDVHKETGRNWTMHQYEACKEINAKPKDDWLGDYDNNPDFFPQISIYGRKVSKEFIEKVEKDFEQNKI